MRYVWDKSKNEFVVAAPRKGIGGLTIIPDLDPFVTDHITGDFVEVRSRRHKKNLLKQHELREHPDEQRGAKNRRRFDDGRGSKKGLPGSDYWRESQR